MQESENIETGYLISSKEGESINGFFYKQGQMPINWIYKGKKHHRDANIFYKVSEEHRLSIISELQKREFNFEYFFRNELTGTISEVIDKNPEIILPDFDAFYFLIHLSFENFLKSIWLDQNHDKLGFDKLPNQLKTHNLSYLCDLTGLTLSYDEKELMLKLTDLSQNYCRYPIKLSTKEESKDFRNLDTGDKTYETVCFDCLKNPYQADRELCNSFLENTLKKELNSVSQNHELHLRTVFDDK